MNVSTLRNWGGAVAVSLPKKLLAALGLKAGAEVEVKIKDGSLVLSPVRGRHTLAQLEKEQRSLERSLRGSPADKQWLESAPRGREQLWATPRLPDRGDIYLVESAPTAVVDDVLSRLAPLVT